jgi:MarR family transcriptional regulator, organic hydroperoxide resistance regulator
MTASPDTPQAPTLGQLLAQVCRLAGKRRRLRLERLGLHHAQGMVLFHLWKEDGISQRDLAAALQITPPTASNTLQRMERDGWVERRRDDADQRIVRVYLTAKARDLHEDARASLRDFDREMGSALSAAEQAALRKSLLKVQCYLEQVTAAGEGEK